MKLRIFINFVIAILLTTMPVVTNADAQDASSEESTSTHPKDDYSSSCAEGVEPKIGCRALQDAEMAN